MSKTNLSVAFATCRAWRNLSDDDQLVAHALRAQGVSVTSAIWDAPDIDWSSFDTVIIRSTWDYHHAPDQFAKWVRNFSAGNPRLWNPPELVLQNMDKRYLCDLACKGVATVPTAYLPVSHDSSLHDTLTKHNWDDVVIKPAVSAAAFHTWRTSLAFADRDQQKFIDLLKQRDLLIQPFMPEIASHGEWSFIFIAGAFSHAVLKRPAPADFRVQREFGGTHLPAQPPPSFIAQAASILAHVASGPLYARVDAIARNDHLILMELELIEPFLFLNSSQGAVHRFAQAIVAKIGK